MVLHATNFIHLRMYDETARSNHDFPTILQIFVHEYCLFYACSEQNPRCIARFSHVCNIGFGYCIQSIALDISEFGNDSIVISFCILFSNWSWYALKLYNILRHKCIFGFYLFACFFFFNFNCNRTFILLSHLQVR